MSRPPDNPAPEKRITRAMQWVERQGFANVAADLREALADLRSAERPTR